MKQLLPFIFTLLFLSCANDDANDFEPLEQISAKDISRIVKVNIFYVKSKTSPKSEYNIDEIKYLEYLNTTYFYRYGIGLELSKSDVLINDELYDLRDNVGNESSTFLMNCRASHDRNKINIYIIKSSNVIGISGIGRGLRVLLTDKSLFTSTSPHEIGHALGLFHTEETTNIMSQTLDKHLRMFFNEEQEETLKKNIDKINHNAG